ncbi:MAG: DUF484 family protein [Nitrospina sp.]|nr:MAG: DUF484 family protein [Nitrospina sp.]
MNKDQVAVYLNEHPEFFNEFPELLHKIKSIEIADLPIAPLQTLSIADRILKRAQDDKEHFRSQLEWFMEIIEANEKIQEQLFEVERTFYHSLDFFQMIRKFRQEIVRRFEIPGVAIFLVKGKGGRLEKLASANGVNGLQWVDRTTLLDWFPKGLDAALTSEMAEGSPLFKGYCKEKVQSQIILPIRIHGQLAGALALGSANPLHFYEGLRTDYLERTADKLGMAMDNQFLVDRVRHQPIRDAITGVYHATCLEPILEREFGWVRRNQTTLAGIKMRIDYFGNLINTYGKPQMDKVLAQIGKILVAEAGLGNLLIRTSKDTFLILLPGVNRDQALPIAERIRDIVESHSFNQNELEKVTLTMGITAYPSRRVNSPAQFIEAAVKAIESGETDKRRVVLV